MRAGGGAAGRLRPPSPRHAPLIVPAPGAAGVPVTAGGTERGPEGSFPLPQTTAKRDGSAAPRQGTAVTATGQGMKGL